MLNVILMGGNGYLGRNFVAQWLQNTTDDVHFYVLSRSGKNQQVIPAVTTLAVDVTDEEAVLAKIPEQVDYIVDFVGAPNKDPHVFKKLNQQPAHVMRQVAEKKHCRAMGFVGGVLGPKQFTSTKKQLIKYLQESTIPLAYVEPTLVYGAGRHDPMTRNVPVLKFLGIFSKKFKPVLVGDVVNELREKLVKAGR
ncbi:NAD-dependent epimerase/dehydratase family protein [Limosilactobacillus viscerum]|uniref:NAD-dependent epimerase/dehydratase family protein n=1 Tax=Limosilactobacillus viscerum TaxID=2993450 RepID=UPI0024BAFE5E|nr:NAD-dependent epimerase/dehydratase family protein [Limosilactobacillus viscerum]